MARELTDAVAEDLAGDSQQLVLFYEGEFASGTLRLCSLPYNVTWDGQTWLGAGELLSWSGVEETTELKAAGSSISLACTDAIVQLALAQSRTGQSGKVWLGTRGEEVIESGTAQAGASLTLTLASDASATDGAYDWMTLAATWAGQTQERTIKGAGYVGATRVATVTQRWATNLLLQSENLGTTWTNTRSSESLNATTAPNGTATADKLVEDGTADNTHLMQQNKTFTNAVHVFSAYVKAAERKWVRLRLNDGTNSYGRYFDIENGAVGTQDITGNGAISSVGDGWYRCVLTSPVAMLAAAGFVQIVLSGPDGDGDQVYSGDGSSGLYVWGMQLEAAATVGDYVSTATTAVDVPDSAATYTVTRANGIVADPYLAHEGRLDVPTVKKGERPVVTIAYESWLRDLERANEMRMTDQDQQRIFPGDRFFARVPGLQEKVVNW